MLKEIAIGGSGGQGVLFIGKLLAEAALLEDKQVVWMPSYGAEKRGGSVYCSIIISDKCIGAMFVGRPDIAVAMDPKWLDRFTPIVKSGGTLIIAYSTSYERLKRADIEAISIPADKISADIGNSRVANLIILGSLIKRYPVVSINSITVALNITLSKDQKSLNMNKQALQKGFTMV